jgi:C-terminal processing protease CtpA/Prc
MFKRVLSSLLLFQASLSAQIPTENQKIVSHLEGFRNGFESVYAPAEWKKEQFGWDWNQEVDKTRDLILNATQVSHEDYRKLLVKLANSAKDYHVGVYFYSTEYASLPFTVKQVNNKYYITTVHEDGTSPLTFPIKPGDEVVTFGGRPVDDVVQAIRNDLRQSNPNTDQAMGENFLTTRMAFRGMSVPRGVMTIGIRHASSDKVKEYQVFWDYFPELIRKGMVPMEMADTAQDFTHLPSSLLGTDFLFFEMHSKLIEKLTGEKPHYYRLMTDRANPNALATHESFLPKLGIPAWESYAYFHSYIYTNDQGKRIGYIRIPTYNPDKTNEYANAFAEIIKMFEGQTDALVVDQLNNPGGNSFYLYSLLSMLTDKPMQTPLNRLKLTQEDVAMALYFLEGLGGIENDEEAIQAFGGEVYEGIPVNYQLVQYLVYYFEFIIREWNQGKTLTDPIYLTIYDKIPPNPKATYSKPILFLINELDMSCGDFAPAILQDNKRVTLFGSRTCGAGGAVKSFIWPNPYGLYISRITTTIAYRMNGQPIENLGVTPDIPYEFTENDVLNGYVEYANAVNAAVNTLFE